MVGSFIDVLTWMVWKAFWMCSYVLMSLLILLSKRLSATLLMRQIFLIY